MPVRLVRTDIAAMIEVVALSLKPGTWIADGQGLVIYRTQYELLATRG